jgi:hypothetical protein
VVQTVLQNVLQTGPATPHERRASRGDLGADRAAFSDSFFYTLTLT